MLLKWIRSYCFRIRSQLAAQAFCGVAFALLLFSQFSERIAATPFLFANLASLVLCLGWGWLQGSEDFCLQHLGKKDSQLEEALRTELELWQLPSTSPENAYFRNCHLQDLEKKLRNCSLPSWIAPIFLLSFVMQSVLFGIGWQLSSAPASIATQTTVNIPHSFRILYPAYLKRESQNLPKLPESLKLPQGSRLEIILQKAAPDSDQSHFVNSTKKISLQWFEQQKRWVSSLTPNKSGTLFLEWMQQEVKWQVIPDAKPTLTLKWVLPPNFVFDNEQIFLELSAQDDIALSQIILHYQIQEQVQEQVQKQVQKQGNTAFQSSKTSQNPPPVFQEVIQSFEGTFASYQERYPWDLSLSSVRAGDTISAWVTVSDTDSFRGPKITRSKVFQFQIESRKKFHAQLLKRLYQLDAELYQLQGALEQTQLQKSTTQETTLLKKLKSLQKDMGRDRFMTEALVAYVNELKLKLNYYQEIYSKQMTPLSPPS